MYAGLLGLNALTLVRDAGPSSIGRDLDHLRRRDGTLGPEDDQQTVERQMLKSDLLAALRTEIHRHDFSHFVDDPPSIARGGRPSFSRVVPLAARKGSRDRVSSSPCKGTLHWSVSDGSHLVTQLRTNPGGPAQHTCAVFWSNRTKTAALVVPSLIFIARLCSFG